MLTLILNQNWDKYKKNISNKMNKSEKFSKNEPKVINEYDGDGYLDEKEDEKPQYLEEGQ